MKVYKVKVEFATYVLAESEKDAVDQVTSNSCQWIQNTNLEQEATILAATEVTSIDEVPQDWQDSYPHTQHHAKYRDSAFRTIRRIVEGDEN